MDQIGDNPLVVAGDGSALHPSVYAAMERRSGTGTGRTRHNRNLPRPFDKTRCGMLLGEGAGCLSGDYEHARARGAKMYAELEGWGFTCDAHSMVKPPAPGKSNNGPPGWHSQPPTGSPRRSGLRERLGLGTMELDAMKHRP